jgi:hypothetical protein
MDLWTIAQAHTRERRSVAKVATTTAMRAWRTLDSTDLAGSWLRAGPRIYSAVTAGQYAAAASTTDYITAALSAQDDPSAAPPTVNPRAFVGFAADGRPLDSLIRLPLAAVYQRIGSGMPAADALDLGGGLLAMLADSEVADAGRGADSVAMTAETKVAGYIRIVSAGACGRCAILAGRWYRWNAGFARHPHCHCQQVPATDRTTVAGHLTDPHAYFASLSPAEQDRAFTVAGAQAIRDGADIYQVVNARRGMSTARIYGHDLSTTTEGITRRGIAGQRMRAAGTRAPVRLTPDAIYALASDRDDAIRLLRRYGYIL